MTKFSYKVKDTSGKTVTGVIDGSDIKAVSATLRDQGLFVVDIRTDFFTSLFTSVSELFLGKVGLSEIANFTRQLSVMISSGLTLTESLAILKDQTNNPRFEKVLSRLLSEVEEGASFSKALGNHSGIFPEIYVGVVRAGEGSGLLSKMLVRLADTLEQQREFRSKTLGTLMYPVIVLIAMAIVVAIMMLFVIPQLSTLYGELGTALPLPTQIVLTISTFFVKFWYIMAAAIAGAFFGFASWKKTKNGKVILDRFMLTLPVFGPLERNVNFAQITRMLALLTASGTPIIEALQNVGKSTGNVIISQSLLRVATSVEKGSSLGVAFSQESVLPPLIAQMARVGEETGKMDEVMEKISAFFESEAERIMKNVSTLLQPFILIVLGGGVGFLMIAVLAPMYNLVQQF